MTGIASRKMAVPVLRALHSFWAIELLGAMMTRSSDSNPSISIGIPPFWRFGLLSVGLIPHLVCTPTQTNDTSEIDTDLPGIQAVCPANMVPVGARLDTPDFCIDVYEVTVTGDLGDADQTTHDSTPPDAMADSLANQIPTTQVSFGQAKAICEQTPVVDAGGVTHGFKRLPLHSEWEDAADGVMGSGGWNYPYGDTWIDHVCAMPLADGEVVLDSLQATGQFQGCLSPFGVYDALGNAWEWTDSGIRLDIEAWFERAEELNVAIELGPDDTLISDLQATEQLTLRMQGLVDRTPWIGDGGVLMMGATAFDPNAYGIEFKGYLVLDDGTAEGLSLPVWFDIPPRKSGSDDPVTTTDEPILVLWSADHDIIPDKRGCGYYAGSAEGCRLDARGLGHLHDFRGLISFRCISDPL